VCIARTAWVSHTSRCVHITHTFMRMRCRLATVVEPHPLYRPGHHPPLPPTQQIDGRKAMVHCKAGASRSAMAVLGFLIGRCGVPCLRQVNSISHMNCVCLGRPFTHAHKTSGTVVVARQPDNTPLTNGKPNTACFAKRRGTLAGLFERDSNDCG
jgi:hypothetical protein